MKNKSIKKLLFIATFIFVFGLASPVLSSPRRVMENNMMSGNNAITQSDNGHTAREEAEGKTIWEKLSAKGGSASGGQAQELKCQDLSDENFGSLGEYFMGRMAGEQHEAMNNMMIQAMGEEGEKQTHIAMGKRMSGCEPNAPMPQNMTDSGMMSMMMNMMMGGGMMGGDNSMMGGWGQNLTWWGGIGSWLTLLLWLVWLVVGILAAIWLFKQIIKK